MPDMLTKTVDDLNAAVSRCRAIRRAWGEQHGRDKLASQHYLINAILDGMGL